MDALRNEIFSDLGMELGLINPLDGSAVAGTERSVACLSSKIKNALREVRGKRNYPDDFTEEQILKDLEKHYSNIRELALYDYNQIGGEGQTQHRENGVDRVWKSRLECLNGVVAFCR